MTRDTEGCSDPHKSSAAYSQTTSPTTVSTATTPPTETGGAKSRLFATIRNGGSEHDSQFFLTPMQPLSAKIRNEESENDSLSFMTPSQPLHDKLDELEVRWSNGRPSADTPEHFVSAAGGRMLHRPSRLHAVSLPSPSSVESEQLTPAKKKAVEIIGTPDEFQGRREQTSVFDRLYQEGTTKLASRQRIAERGGRTFHSSPSLRTPQSFSIEGTISTMSSGSVFDRLYKNEKRIKSSVSLISRPSSLTCRDVYQADLASAASSLERRLAYTPPTARRRNHVSGAGKVAYSKHGLQPSVDERTAVSSSDSVFERLYRGEKRKTPVKAVDSTVRTLKTKRDRAEAFPLDSLPSRMSPQKGTAASSDSVFERLYRREKRQTSLLPQKSRIRDRTPLVGSEASPKRDLEIIRSQSVAGTLPCPRRKDGRKVQSLLKKCLFFSEDGDEFCPCDDLPAPTASCYANVLFDAKAYPVKTSKNVVTSGTGRARNESVILNVSPDLQCRVARDVLARLQLQICARRIQRCARAYIARMSFQTDYKSECSALASPSSNMITVLELKYQEHFLSSTSLERRSATSLQKAWRCHRSQIKAADALLKSWRLKCEFESTITDNRILLMKVRLHTLAKAIGRVDCFWITEMVSLEDDLVHVKWEREVGVHLTDRGVPKLESCIISLDCEANHFSFTDKWSRRKLAILIVKAGLERHLICDRAGLLKQSVTVIQTWIRMKKTRIAFIWKVDSCRIIQRFFRGKWRRYKLDQKKDAGEQSEARTISKLSLTDHVTHGKLIDLICCHDESDEFAETDDQSHVHRFLIVRRVLTGDQASRSIQCFVRRYRGIRSAQSRRAAAILIQASVRRFYQRLKSDRNQKSAMKLQGVWRAIATRRSFLELRSSAIRIQAIERRRQCFVLSSKLCKAKVCELKTRVTMIQSLQRGAQIRDQLTKQRKSATKIQCSFRRHEATRSLHIAYAGVVALQAAHRGIKARRLIMLWHTLVANARLAILVQTMWRGSRIRAQHALLHVSATYIQSAYRRHSALRFFRTLITRIITLQIVYRRVRSCRVTVRAKSSLKLQKVWRGSRSRVMVVSLLETIQSERMAKEESAAAAAIQSWYRCRELCLDFVALRQAAVVIQTSERRRKCLSGYVKQSFAAVRIQAAWKGYRIRIILSLARENAQMLQKRAMVAGVIAFQHVARSWLEKKVIAVVLIQSLYRKGCLYKEFWSKKQSATRIQIETRRRQCAAKYTRVLRGTLLLQAHYRGSLTRRLLLRRMEMEKAAAAVIQAYYRGFFLRQRFLTLKLSSVRIQRCLRHTAKNTRVLLGTIRLQAHFRGFLARWILSRRAETEEAATVVIQSFFRSAVLRQNFLMLKQIVVRIQAVERHRQCVIKYALLRRGVICAQGLYRAFMARRMIPRLAETDEKKEAAAVVVQAHYRGFSLRQHFLTLREIAVRIQAAERRRQHRANYHLTVRGAIRLQEHHRGFSTRRMLPKCVEGEEGSAVVIQTFYKGSFLRQQFLAMKQVIIRIQAAERRRQSLSNYKFALCGTVRLQAIHRGFLTRLSLTRTAEVEQAAAVIMQAYYRGLFLHRKFLAVRQAAIRIQAANRRRHSLSSYGLIRGETVRLQALHRGFLTRQMLARRAEMEEKAAVVMQTHYRRLSQRQQFVTLTQSVVRIQCAERRRQQLANYFRAVRGTVRLQAHQRGFLARRMSARRVEAEEAATIVIQTFFRGFFLRQKFLALEQVVIQIQAAVRRRQYLSSYSIVLYGMVRLQALHRGLLTRLGLARRAEMKEAAAVSIQSYHKGFACRQALAIRRRAAVRIQALERRRLSLSMYAVVLVGIVRLQAQYRGLQIRRLITELAAAVLIQSCYRKFVSRQFFLTCRVDVVRVQTIARRRHRLSQYWGITRGMVRLQALYRGSSVKRWLRLQEKAARIIQVFWRVALEARRFCDPIHSAAAKRIQVAYFTWKMRATLLMVESSVVLLQRSVRGQLRRSAARFALSHINVSFRSTTLTSFARITNNLDSSVISINHAWSKAVVLAREAACIVTQSAARRMLAILHTADLRKRSGLPGLRRFVNRNAASAFMPHKSKSPNVSSTGRRKGQRGATKHCCGRLSSATALYKKPADVVSEPERPVYRYCSAQVIQRAFRAYSKRSSIRVHHAAARQLQKFYRQRSAMAQYAISRTGALCLQSQFRGACVRSEVAAMKLAVVRLQQVWRTHVRYRTIRDATLLIQQALRSHLKRTTMRVKHVTACHLQRFYRQRWAMARYVIIRRGVICLQSQFRGACVRSEVAAMTSAVVRLQQMWRIHRMGIRYCSVWDATLLIQANYRMRAASRAFDFHRNAAVAIQTLYRSWHGRKTSFHRRIYQEHLQLRLEKSIKSQANETSRKVVNGILDRNECYAGICVGRLAHRYQNVAEKSKSMIAIASAEKQKDCRLSEYSSRPRNAAVDVNAGADDVVTDECIEVAAGRAAAAMKDAATSSSDKVNRLDTQLGTASKMKAPSVPPAASRLAVDEPKKQVNRATETRTRPTSPSTLQLAMEAQQLLREARHARARFHKTRSTAPTSKACTTLSRNDRTHESVPPSKSTNRVADHHMLELSSPIKPKDGAWDWTKGWI